MSVSSNIYIPQNDPKFAWSGKKTPEYFPPCERPQTFTPRFYSLPSFYWVQGISLESLATSLPNRPREIEAQVFIVSLICRATNHRAGSYHKPTGYVSINATWLRDQLGQHYADKALRALEAQGIIRANRSYSAGRFSRSYKLAPHLVPYVLWRADTKDNLFLQNMAQIQILHTADEVIQAANSQQRQAIQRFLAGGDYLYFERDNTIYRWHGNIHSLTKELRPHLRVDGSTLYSVDWSGAHPLIVAKLCVNWWMGENSTTYPTPYPSTPTVHPPYVGKLYSGSATVSLPDDLTRFVELCETGEIYSWLGEKWRETYGRSPSRDKIKLRLLVYFNKERAKGRIGQLLAAHFPSVNKFLGEVKQLAADGTYHDHTALAHLMLREETRLVYEYVVPKVKRLGVWFIPFHDGIICKEADACEIQNTMLAALQSGGYSATVKSKAWE